MSLTLAEARHRTETVEVDAYGIDLDLTGWERGRFACTTTGACPRWRARP